MSSFWEEEIKRFKRFAFHFVISSTLGATITTACAPIDRVKLILQSQDSSSQILSGERKRYKNMFDAFVRIPKEQGFFSLWRGNLTNVIRHIPSQGMTFAFNDMYNEWYIRFWGQLENPNSPFPKIVSGGLAGITACALLYPLEFCYLRLAVDIGDGKKVQREFLNTRDCVKKVIKSDGIFGPYRGIGVAFFGVAIYRSIYFGVYDFGKQWLIQNSRYTKKNKTTGLTELKFVYNLLLAQLTTMGGAQLVYPLDTVGRRMMLQSGKAYDERQFHTYVEAVKFIYKNEGIVGFFKANMINMIRTFGGALVIVIYDKIKRICNVE